MTAVSALRGPRPTGRSLPDRVYHRALALATRAVVEPVLGARYLSRAAEIDRWWHLSDADREAWRAVALESILRYGIDHVPAYGHRNPVLADFPITDKQDIIAQPERYLSTERASIPVVEKHTGGSTGDPWNYPLDRRAWAESYAAQILAFARHDIAYGDRRLLLGFPASLGLQGMGPGKRLRLLAERTDVSLSGFEVDPETSLRRAELAVTMKARLWYGYASTIAAMASAVLNAGQRLPGPNLIVTMAEPLMPSWHDDIAAAFGTKVVEEYGCNDGGIMAHRCDAGNLHLADHQSLVEVVDEQGRACPPGVDGAIVITNFHARHMPFIRYRVGDIGTFGPNPCPCRQPGRTLARVSGRSGDFVRLPDGTELTPPTFYNPFNQATGVRRWQIVQPDPTRLVVRIETRDGWDDDDRSLIVNWIEEQTRHQLIVELRETEPFDLTRGGKHRIIIREF